ncbi:hypothetical protein [Cellulosimicrobium protaetiae]
MDAEPDDEPLSAGGVSPQSEGRFDGDGSPEGEGRSDRGGQQADGPRPGLVGVLWCVVVIVAVLVIGVAMGMLGAR